MFKNLLKINQILGKYRWYHTLSAILLLVSIIARAFEPKVLQVAVDGVIATFVGEHGQGLQGTNSDIITRFFAYLLPELTADNFGKILLLLGAIYMVISLIRGGFLFTSSAIKHHATQSTIYKLRNTTFDHIQFLPLKFFTTISKGELIQRCTGDIDTIKDFIDNQIIAFLRLSATFFFSFVMMYLIHPQYAWWSVCLAPFIFILSWVFFAKEKKVWKAHEEEADKLNTMVQENLNGIRVVAAFSNQQFEINRFKQQNIRKMHMGIQQAKLQATFWPLTDLLVNLQLVISVLIGGYFTIQGKISVGELLGFYSYISMVSYPMRQLGKVLSKMGMAIVAMGRISEILAYPLESNEGTYQPEHLSGKIEFKNVHFAYENQQTVLSNFSLCIQSGEQVAIIGPSGAGKSTLIKLLLRFYEPSSGEILLDDVPLQHYDKAYLRRKIGAAFQKAFLFSTTINQNIAYAMDAWNEEGIDEAAKIARAYEMKLKFKHGFETMVGEKGVTLSGGQKQRVALARTVMVQPEIIILDDTTSAVDTVTEKAILKELDQSLEGKTALIIAHRIASIHKAQRIIVMDKGKIVQEGTQFSLKNGTGYYQSIHSIQSELEAEIKAEMITQTFN